ncbi:MAG: fibrobacter succinogenes major paralogous domain-containing protein [Algoriphagus sp.]|nr:fibrobacter succinogenes major paralogous domain-containing protein [Algoriphagus sp.]
MKKHYLFTLIFFLICLLSFAQQVVIDGQTYKTVKIGSQTWMAENLNVTKFRNGEDIPLALVEEEWWMGGEDGIPAYVDVEFDSENGQFFGKLYNYFAVSDPRGIAPEGWRVPTDADWAALAASLGGPEVATAKLKSSEGWLEENGTNESGFTAFPVGSIDADGYFLDQGFFGFFWSSTENDGFVLNRSLSENKYPFEAAESFKSNGFSLRLIKVE